MAASTALITTGVKKVRVQKTSLDVVWNTFAIFIFVYYVCINVRVCMYVCVCVCMYVYTYVCAYMYVCTYVFIYVSVYMYVFTGCGRTINK